MNTTPQIHAFFDSATNTVSYIVYEATSLEAAIIDSVADFDLASGRVSYESANKLIAFVKEHGLEIKWILETHIHADHLTAAPYLKENLGGKIAIGANIQAGYTFWQPVFHLPEQTAIFDHLWHDNEEFQLGSTNCKVIATPGHTAVDVSYLIGDALFVGDSIFMPDFGTARCDFPGGSANTLYQSIQRLFALPDETRVFVGHDYLPSTRQEFQWESSMKQQKEQNVHVNTHIVEQEFVAIRKQRDQTLSVPRLIIPSLQFNLLGGRPQQSSANQQHLYWPINHPLFTN